MRSDDILDQIDSALHDFDVSDDAMRSRPADGTPAEPSQMGGIVPVVQIMDEAGEWQEVGGITSIDFHIEPPTIDPEFARTWQAFREQLAHAEAERVQQASRTLAQPGDAFQHLPEAVGCNDCGKPAPPRDRPAWQSRYGPAHQRRNRR